LASNVYECLFILDSNRYAREASAVAATIPAMVQNLGGEVLANRLWNEQKLAYPIRGHRKGTYWLTYFRLDSTRLPEFNRACRLNDNVLRNLVLRVEPRLVTLLVSHALGKSAPVAPERPSAPPTETREAVDAVAHEEAGSANSANGAGN